MPTRYQTLLESVRHEPRNNPAIVGMGDCREYFQICARRMLKLCPGTPAPYLVSQASAFYANEYGQVPETPEQWCEAVGVLEREWERQVIAANAVRRRTDAFFLNLGK